MPRRQATGTENNFSAGLMTENTGLNVPENFVFETWNNYHETNGMVRRRLGIDIEAGTTASAARSYDASSGVVVEYLWKAVARTGSYTFLVLQIGDSVSFFELGTNQALIDGAKNFAVNLVSYQAAGGGTIADRHCSFSSGQGRLVITHPACDPVLCVFNDDDNTLTQTRITIKVRDFEGEEDGLEIDETPSSLSSEHLYNLMNQGWYKNVSMVVQGGGAGNQFDLDDVEEEFDVSLLL